MTALAVSGWLLALAALAVAALQQARFSRHAGLVAQACHELRGALCAAQLAVEALGEPRVQLDLRRAALALEDLDQARENRRAAECRGVVDLAELAEELAAGWGSRVTLGPVASVPVHVDRLRLGQAISNLLRNALEHGEGPVAVSVRRCGSHARVEVSDAGAGLPAPLVDLVRAGRHRRSVRGHGLVIAARIAEAAGGRLLSAPTAAGARVAVELPVFAPADASCPAWALGEPEGAA